MHKPAIYPQSFQSKRSRRSIRSGLFPAAFLCVSALLAGPAAAVDLGTYKGCAATDGDFKSTQLYNGGNGLKMAFAQQDDGGVDVYFIQKNGAVKRWNAKGANVTDVGTIPNDASGEYGLVGIAADPDFRKNSTLYFTFTASESGKFMYHISRFKLDAAGAKLDMASEKILIRFPAEREPWHSAGAMAFDAYGDLYIAVGDNEKIDEGPGNTADLRGGILRIHPDDSPKGYSIPKGNFGERFAAVFKEQGKADLAAVYADTAKVKPETYVKGTRNAYTVTLDPVRRWLTWGDVGPDQGRVSEEYNLVHQAEFTGWPYFAGEENMAGINPYHYNVPAGSTRLVPINKAAENGTVNGSKVLPALREPILARQQGCAMTGPIFRYDGRIKSAGNFPPQLNRKWLVSGCDSYGFHILTLDEAGEKITSNVVAFASIRPSTLVDLQQGPDGSLYYVSNNTGVYRLDYTGACKDPALIPEATGCADAASSNYDPAVPKAFHDPRKCATGIAGRSRTLAPESFRISGNSLSIGVSGSHRVEFLGVDGTVRLTLRGEGARSYELPSSLPSGVYQVRAETDSGNRSMLFYRGF
jgi:glucose/arabinose dehydrogenase